MSGPQPFQTPGPRICVIGITGSGKTTTAARLAQIMGILHVELDAIHWLPGWQQRDLEPFRALVAQAVDRPTWVSDGNYSKVRDLLWDRATTLVWLDYPLVVTLWLLLKRTLKRLWSKELLWNTNRESWKNTFFTRDSLFVWALQSYPKLKREYPLLLKADRYAHLQVICLTSPRQTSAWLAWLAHHAPSIRTSAH